MCAGKPAFGFAGMEPRKAGKRVRPVQSNDQPHHKLRKPWESALPAIPKNGTGHLFGAETSTGGKPEAIPCSLPGMGRVGGSGRKRLYRIPSGRAVI